MNYLHYNLTLTNQSCVQVSLSAQANVRLMDSSNFQKFRAGSKHSYFGGRAAKTPYTINSPHSGSWHLVVDTGGRGKVTASVKVL